MLSVIIQHIIKSNEVANVNRAVFRNIAELIFIGFADNHTAKLGQVGSVNLAVLGYVAGDGSAGRNIDAAEAVLLF